MNTLLFGLFCHFLKSLFLQTKDLEYLELKVNKDSDILISNRK